MTGVFIRRGHKHMTQTHEHHVATEADTEAAASHGASRIAGNHQNLGRHKEGFSSLGFKESTRSVAQSCPTLRRNLGFLTSTEL